MIKPLPTHFAEITTVRLVNGEPVEETKFLLLDMLNFELIRGLDENADFKRFDMLGEGIINEEPKVVNIKFLDTDNDQYQEFVTSVNFADMQRSIVNLGKVVCCEFESILKRCPENYESLFELLKTHVLSN